MDGNNEASGTVERREAAYFDEFYGGQAYNPVGNRLRFLREVRLFQKLAASKRLGRVLSLGCGDGQLESLVAASAERVVALDISPVAIAVAHRRAEVQGTTNLEFRCLPFAALHWDEQFDAIICIAFLHHVRESEMSALLKKCFEHLKAGGFFYSSEPNKKGLLRTLGRAMMGRSYDKYHSPDERELDPRELARDLSSAGFRAVSIRYTDVTLIPGVYLLAKRAGWPLYLCSFLDFLWCHSPVARWASGFVAIARKA